jgi:hypothetical protein
VISAVPELTPITTPDAEPTAALPVDPDVHVPPGEPSVSVIDDPAQTAPTPAIASGVRSMEIFLDEVHPVPSVYLTVTEPVSSPVTIPVRPIVARSKLLLLQVPPEGVAERLKVLPRHTDAEPLIADGRGLIVSVCIVKQPVANV